MTPYELRFEIFKQARELAESQFSADMELAQRWNHDSINSVRMDYPEFPSYQKIEELAEKINSFVSSK
jgi:hypothetical protein